MAFLSAVPASLIAMSSFALALPSENDRSVHDRFNEVIVFRLLCELGFLALPCRLSCNAAAKFDFDGVDRIDAEEFERGRCRPWRFSSGGSRRAIFVCLSDVREVEKEFVAFSGNRELLSESESESESSYKFGYRHLSDLVGLGSTTLVSALALPLLSTVRTTEAVSYTHLTLPTIYSV